MSFLLKRTRRLSKNSLIQAVINNVTDLTYPSCKTNRVEGVFSEPQDLTEGVPECPDSLWAGIICSIPEILRAKRCSIPLPFTPSSGLHKSLTCPE